MSVAFDQQASRSDLVRCHVRDIAEHQVPRFSVGRGETFAEWFGRRRGRECRRGRRGVVDGAGGSVPVVVVFSVPTLVQAASTTRINTAGSFLIVATPTMGSTSHASTSGEQLGDSYGPYSRTQRHIRSIPGQRKCTSPAQAPSRLPTQSAPNPEQIGTSCSGRVSSGLSEFRCNCRWHV